MTKRQAERLLNLYGACSLIGLEHANVDKLLRIEKTLRRWAALECNGNIERDESTGKCHGVFIYRDHSRGTYKVADRETGALRRLRAILEPLGLYYYHQSDPRGCALYVSDKPIPDNDYNRQGIAVCID